MRDGVAAWAFVVPAQAFVEILCDSDVMSIRIALAARDVDEALSDALHDWEVWHVSRRRYVGPTSLASRASSRQPSPVCVLVGGASARSADLAEGWLEGRDFFSSTSRNANRTGVPRSPSVGRRRRARAECLSRRQEDEPPPSAWADHRSSTTERSQRGRTAGQSIAG